MHAKFPPYANAVSDKDSLPRFEDVIDAFCESQTASSADFARCAAAHDPVTKPVHYQRGGIETIDYIRATLGDEGYASYCLGNVLKYVSRYRDKDGVQDLKKAKVYLEWAIAAQEQTP